MATAVLLDENIRGFGRRLDRLIDLGGIRYYADELHLKFLDLGDVGLASGDSDEKVWRHCQAEGLYLLTDNRTDKNDSSLQSVIARFNTPDCLPVFTIGNKAAFQGDSDYASKCVEELIDRLLYPSNILGLGRIFLPKGVS